MDIACLCFVYAPVPMLFYKCYHILLSGRNYVIIAGGGIIIIIIIIKIIFTLRNGIDSTIKLRALWKSLK